MGKALKPNKYKLIIGNYDRAPWSPFFNFSYFRSPFSNDPDWFILFQASRFTFQLKRLANYSLGHTYWWGAMSPKKVKEWVFKDLGIKGTVWEKL